MQNLKNTEVINGKGCVLLQEHSMLFFRGLINFDSFNNFTDLFPSEKSQKIIFKTVNVVCYRK